MQIASEPYEFTALVGRAITPCLRHVPLGAVILIAALGLGCSGAVTEATTPSDTTAETVTQITAVDPARAAALLGNSHVVVLDIRTPREFSKGHLRGATNVDFTARDFADRVAALDRDRTYLLYCAIGGRSAQSLAVFEKLQFKSILHLEDGIKGWRSAGQPVED